MGRLRNLNWNIVLPSIFVVVVASIGVWRLFATHAQTIPVGTPCHHTVGPFAVSGSTVTAGDGKRYVPYGINISGLPHSNYTAYIAADKQQIAAASSSWCANTVRIMASQEQLIVGTGYNRDTLGINEQFLAAVKDEVAYARSLGLVVVLTLQTQSDTDADIQIMPTERSLKWWYRMGSEFGGDQSVIFDLFNEPRFTSLDGESDAVKWSHWRNGFSRNGVNYYGFQQFASQLRTAHVRNLFWVEGPSTSRRLDGIKAYGLTGVGPLMYSEHHPVTPNSVDTWRSAFGYLAEQNIAPVVMGEWAQYSSSHDGAYACWTDAPVTVPNFLNYLKGINVGMIAYKLTPGVLIPESGDLAAGNTFGPNWGCRDSVHPSYGAGKLIQDWFYAQNYIPQSPPHNPPQPPTPPSPPSNPGPTNPTPSGPQGSNPTGSPTTPTSNQGTSTNKPLDPRQDPNASGVSKATAEAKAAVGKTVITVKDSSPAEKVAAAGVGLTAVSGLAFWIPESRHAILGILRLLLNK